MKRWYAGRCEICDVPSAKFEATHLFDLAREQDYLAFYEDDPEHIPISINNAENGLLLCRNCHGYFDNKPQCLMHIKINGTIELTGKAKEQKHGPGGACLHGKIIKKDWPTSALLYVVYHIKAKSRKRKCTDLDLGIVDAADLHLYAIYLYVK